MKKILYFFLIFATTVQSQKNDGIAIYKMILSDKKDFSDFKSGELKDRLENMQNEVEKMHPKLKFNKQKAVFYLDGLINDAAEMAGNLYCQCYNGKYIDLQTQKTYQSSEAGIVSENGEYTIERPILNNWKITTETKLISEYKCIKATQTVYTSDALKQEVIAWFCPDLNIPFGPNGYAGLPGLIIELQQAGVVFGLESLKFSKKQIDIKIPTKGKTISFDDYYRLTKKKIAELKIDQINQTK